MRANFALLSFFIIIFLHFLSGQTHSQLVPALYVFGDSLVDSGNNNLLPVFARANYWPYGNKFGSVPTGRFTNGKTVADFIAEYLGLPPSPSHLSMKGSILQTGVNYASGSCGILPETGMMLGKCLNLNEQVNLFQRAVEFYKLPMQYGSLSDHLTKSIFLISAGSNDYINNYLLPLFYSSSRIYSPQSYAKHLTDGLSYQLQRLYNLGARKMVVFGLGPLGCMPSITNKVIHQGKCVEKINELAILYNNQLETMLNDLSPTLEGSTIVRGNAYGLGYDAVINPSTYGLTDSSNPCCVTWANGTSLCIPNLVPCQDSDKHYFWDGYHLTEAVYSVIGKNCIAGTDVCVPMNITQLAKV